MTAFAFLEPDECKVRRQWLIGFVILAVVTALQEISEFSVMSLVTLIMLYLLYHCSYRNPGTVLLTFKIATTILTFPRDIIEICKDAGSEFVGGELYIKIIYVVILSGLLFGLGWWIKLSIDVRRINKQVRRRCVYASSEYQEALTAIAQADTLDAVNQAYYRIDGLVGGDIVKEVRLLYNERKFELQNQKRRSACLQNAEASL